MFAVPAMVSTMNLYARVILRRWLLAPWPDGYVVLYAKDDMPNVMSFEDSIIRRVDILSGIQSALRDKLFTREELYITLRYLAGYEERQHEQVIIRVITTLATVLKLTDYEYIRRKKVKDPLVYLAEMTAVDLWENWKVHESAN